MELKKLLANLENVKAKGNLDIDVKNIESDSRKIKSGSMFVAIKGFEVDGHNFINQAIENGAIAVMVQKGANLKEINLNENVTLIQVPDTRLALSICACNFYGNPSKKFKLIGITGTKGKTTTSYMLKAILEKGGYKVGLIGTIACYIGEKKIEDSERTTPESTELQKMFAQMYEENVDVVIMEVSSQSIKLNRVAGCDFDIGVFTNFSEDHISPKEHLNMEDYFDSKAKLFKMCKYGFINSDDINVIKLKTMETDCDIHTYGIDNACDLLAKDLTVMNTGSDFKVKLGDRNQRVKVCIPGRFSVYNALAAISVALKFGVKPEDIIEALLNTKVPGRSELISNSKGLAVMIDYAHSPESLSSILKAVKTYTTGRIICVFGCGGDRDTTKRPIMGEISGNLADFTIITTDNPRKESPSEIIKEIENGIKNTNGKYICIEDRRDAIKYAIDMANKKDVILLAGKGHETYQIIGSEKVHFDEREIVNKIINKK